jgi:hypothetical protein
MAQQLMASLQAHIAEHLAFKYRKQIEERLGAPLPMPDEELPEEIEIQLARLVADAGKQLTQIHQTEAAQQQAQQHARVIDQCLERRRFHAVGEDLADRKQLALEAFIARAGDHETAALAQFHLANLLREQGDLVEARALAAQGLEAHPQSPGGKLCKNLIAEIESKALAVFAERTWARPWPVIRVRYRNLTGIHLRLVKADWLERLRSGKSHWGWLDDAERAALLAAAPAKAFPAELPPTPDYEERVHDIPVPQDLAPGSYWVVASHSANFGEQDNVVAAGLVWVSRIALVTSGANPRTGEPLAGTNHIAVSFCVVAPELMMVGPVMKPDTRTPPSSEMLFAETTELFGLLVREKIAPAGVPPGTVSLLRATTDQPLASPFTSTTWFAAAPRFVMPGPAMRPRK